MKNVFKNKKVLFVSLSVVTLLTIALATVLLNSANTREKEVKKEEDTFALKQDTFTFELGEEVSEEVSTYIEADKDVLKDTTIDLEKVQDEVGTYEASATYKKEALHFEIEIEDTTKPVFTGEVTTIEIEQGSTEDLATRFSAEDLSEVTITIDSEGLDVNVPGTYTIRVIASDAYDNQETKEVSVVVKEKAVEETPQTEGETSTGTTGNTSSGSVSNGTTPTPAPAPTPTPAPQPVPTTPQYCAVETGNSGLLFNSWAEADSWSNDMMANGYEKWFAQYDPQWNGWWVLPINHDVCGNVLPAETTYYTIELY